MALFFPIHEIIILRNILKRSINMITKVILIFSSHTPIFPLLSRTSNSEAACKL